MTETYPYNGKELPVLRCASLDEAEAMFVATTPVEYTLLLREDLPMVAATIHKAYPETKHNIVAVVILEDDTP